MKNLYDDEKETHRQLKKADPVGYSLSLIVAVGCGIPIVLGVIFVVWLLLGATSGVGK